MCVKLSPRGLYPGPCPPHPTSTYTCGVAIVPRVCGGYLLTCFFFFFFEKHTHTHTHIKERENGSNTKAHHNSTQKLW